MLHEIGHEITRPVEGVPMSGILVIMKLLTKTCAWQNIMPGLTTICCVSCFRTLAICAGF
jgi:hypothetical protein